MLETHLISGVQLEDYPEFGLLVDFLVNCELPQIGSSEATKKCILTNN